MMPMLPEWHRWCAEMVQLSTTQHIWLTHLEWWMEESKFIYDKTLTFYVLKPKNNNNTRLTALCPGLPGWASTRKVKPIWILLKQETVSGIGISWAICKSAYRSRQITMPAPHHSVFYRLDALTATQPTESKHWNQRNQQKWNQTVKKAIKNCSITQQCARQMNKFKQVTKTGLQSTFKLFKSNMLKTKGKHR